MRHTPDDTAIEIAAAAANGQLVLRVRDHGPGFAPGEEQRLFAKFHQAKPERAQSGFGLGLVICKAIAEAHGGTISARNATGGGAEFEVTLPLAKPESAGS